MTDAPSPRCSSGSAELLSAIILYFATKQEGLGDGWAHPDDFSSYGLDYRNRDGTQLWITLENDETIHVLWKPAGQDKPTIKVFSGDAQAAPEPRKLGISFVQAMDIAEDGLRRWRDRDHNAKWWRKIDGTPIPNDLLVNIAESMTEAYVAAPQPIGPAYTAKQSPDDRPYCEPLAQGKAFYLAMYEHEGANWDANENQEVWVKLARDYERRRRDACAVSSTDRDTVSPASYCALCDLEHPLHEDAQGFHHVIKGERVACPISSTTGGSAAK